MKKIIDILYLNRPLRIYEDYSPTLRRDRQGLLVIEDNNERFQMFKVSKNRICKKDP